MTNIFDKSERTFTKAEIEHKLHLFKQVNLNVFKAIQNTSYRYMLLELQKAQEAALNRIFFGKKENVNEE